MKDKKTIKKKKGEGLGALLLPLAKAALSVFGSGKKENMARRNRIIMVKQDVPKGVTLPNGRPFLARYKRTTRAHLPATIHLPRPYKQRAAPKGKRRRSRTAAAPAAQQGQGIADIFHFGIKIAYEQLPGAVEKLSGKVKTKRLKKIVGSENVENLVNYGAVYGIKNCSKNILQ